MKSISTVNHVAALAGVSAITVSRVINEPGKVKPETRQRVEEAMQKLSYSPNIVAKNLVSGRTGVIDVYVPENIELSNPFVMHLITGISEVLSEKMYSFLIKRNLDAEHNCDGYIVTGLLMNEINTFYDYAKARNRPVALFGHTDIEDVDFIDVNNVFGAKLATEYLIKNGHTKIAMINIDEYRDHTAERCAGYQNALRDAGFKVCENLIIHSENNFYGGYLAAKKLLQSVSFTAVFCASDVLAIGAVKAMNEENLSIPGDISIVGFDGLGQHTFVEPHITTIEQPILRAGRKLANMLVDRINGKSREKADFLLPELVIGKSVKKLSNINL